MIYLHFEHPFGKLEIPGTKSKFTRRQWNELNYLKSDKNVFLIKVSYEVCAVAIMNTKRCTSIIQYMLQDDIFYEEGRQYQLHKAIFMGYLMYKTVQTKHATLQRRIVRIYPHQITLV